MDLSKTREEKLFLGHFSTWTDIRQHSRVLPGKNVRTFIVLQGIKRRHRNSDQRSRDEREGRQDRRVRAGPGRARCRGTRCRVLAAPGPLCPLRAPQQQTGFVIQCNSKNITFNVAFDVTKIHYKTTKGCMALQCIVMAIKTVVALRARDLDHQQLFEYQKSNLWYLKFPSPLIFVNEIRSAILEDAIYGCFKAPCVRSSLTALFPELEALPLVHVISQSSEEGIGTRRNSNVSSALLVTTTNCNL